MSKLIRFVNAASSTSSSVMLKTLVVAATSSRKVPHILSLIVISRLSWFTALKSPPIVSYAVKRFTTERTLYCKATKEILAICAEKLSD